jgi:hypothetical protein
LEVWRERRVEGKGEGDEREENGYPLPLFGCFKNELISLPFVIYIYILYDIGKTNNLIF